MDMHGAFAVPTRWLGPLEVGAQGLGCLSMTGFYGSQDDAESIATIHRALDLGVTMLDTADVQGFGDGERLLGRALRGRRDRAVVASKFGMLRSARGGFEGLCGDPAYVRRACEASLRRLGIDYIDLYYQHWVDPAVPIEDTVAAMAGLAAEGKVRYLGLSEPAPVSIRRAHAVHPIAAVQCEWSLWSRDIEAEVVPTCRELGIGLVGYAPLGRGFLSGQITSPAHLGDNDFRRSLPRFSAENLPRNRALVEALADVAAPTGCSLAQLALAWLQHQGTDVVPIPGTRRRGHLAENAAAVTVELSPNQLSAVEAAATVAVHGERYSPDMLAMTGH